MKRATITVGCVVLLLLGFAALFWPFTFSYYSVCSKCGALKDARQWQLPHSDFTLFERSSITETPLSRYLIASGTVPHHAHQWMFGHGGGNGVRCALGGGDQIRSVVESQAIVTLLESVRRYGEDGDAAKFLKYTFDPELSRWVVGPLGLGGYVPADGFATREAYRSWMSEHSWLIEDRLDMMRQSDEGAPK